MSKLLSKSRVLSIVVVMNAIACGETIPDLGPEELKDPSAAQVSPVLHEESPKPIDAGVAPSLPRPPQTGVDGGVPTTAVDAAVQADARVADAAPDAAAPTPAVGSFASAYSFFVDNHCSSGCHAAGKTLDLSTPAVAYAQLVGVAAAYSACAATDGGTPFVRVVAGEPAQSLLLQKLEGHQTCGSTMPKAGVLPKESVELVRAWILAGAPAPE